MPVKVSLPILKLEGKKQIPPLKDASGYALQNDPNPDRPNHYKDIPHYASKKILRQKGTSILKRVHEEKQPQAPKDREKTKDLLRREKTILKGE
jgi:hypothetical protein